MWLTARVLEQRRFALHFRDGCAGPGEAADALEAALSAYRNGDHGYGHGLDPDLRGPVSEPLHTVYALRVLEEAGRCSGQRAERVCRYLTSVSAPDGAMPALRPPADAAQACTGRKGPAAPWLRAPTRPCGDLLATGPVVGVLHRNDVWHAWLFRATEFCWAAMERLEKPRPEAVRATVAFLDGVRERPRAEAAADRLGRIVREQRLVVLDPGRTRRSDPPPGADGPAGAHPHACDFAPTPGSLARRWFSDAEIDRSLDVLASAQQADGGWPCRRTAWAPGSTLEVRPIATIDALLTLRAYGREIG
ncbi:conserved protein of unknown function [Streptantibioticus cattleyicolor NRRL 8057 = DSM 46488]|nr:conserved protein of unknown function [Streptantibioticus cattleyicolor NRRL 8057 = DSM 46488]